MDRSGSNVLFFYISNRSALTQILGLYNEFEINGPSQDDSTAPSEC